MRPQEEVIHVLPRTAYPTPVTSHDLLADHLVRIETEQKRYAALYGVNATDLQNFDLAINTKHNDLKTVTAIVCAAYRAWQADEKGR